MIGSSIGWGVAASSGIFHYDGHAWTPAADPAFAGILPGNVALTADGEVWISGVDYSVSVGNGFDGNSPAALLHYDGKRWGKVKPHLANASLNGLAFSSPEQGWAVGSLPTTDQHQAGEADGIIVQYQNGAWQIRQRLIRPFSEQYFALTDVALDSSGEGWAVGNDGVIMRYQNGAWTQAPSPTGEGLSSVVLVSAGEGWAVGMHGTILHEQNGAWSVYAGA